ncbi:MAG: efflux RND transporter permease subunit, partial [Pirellulaceae bacterium]|nr:efflux RND transporter permease subunit [Pirellulaceae bacterium]
MNRLFYDNPRLLVLTISLIVVSGLGALMALPRLEDPIMSERFAFVTTFFPGADAYRVEALVTEVLENEIREVEGIKTYKSSSLSGVSTIGLELLDEISQSEQAEIWSRVRDKLDDAKIDLPSNASDPDLEVSIPKAYAYITTIRWNHSTEPNYAILKRQAKMLADRIRNLSGTEKIDLYGDPEEEIIVELSPDRISPLGLSTESISQQLRNSDTKFSAGKIVGEKSQLLLELEGELDSLERISKTPIFYGTTGQTVQLGDIAEIRKTIKNPPNSIVHIEGQHAIAIGCHIYSNVRIDQWMEKVEKTVADFENELPQGLALTPIFVQNHYVQERLSGLLRNLAAGAIAVLAMVLFFMGWRSAIIVGLALPLSSFIVLTGMSFLNIPMHQMSITGLIIALGLLIDNAIVVVDEVHHRLRGGASGGNAVAGAVSQLAIPLFGSTLTTAISFAPIALMPGGAGEFVGAIAINVVLAISGSFLLAMTITPAAAALANYFFKPANGDGFFKRGWTHGFRSDRLTNIYRGILQFLFARPWLGIGLSLLLPLVGFIQARSLQEQFFPPADRDQFHIQLEMPPQTPLRATSALAQTIRETLLQEKGVQEVHWFAGRSAPPFYYNLLNDKKNVDSYAQALVQLDSAGNYREIIRKVQRNLDRQYPQARIIARQLEQGPPFEAPVEYQIFGPDLETLRQLGQQVRKVMAETPDVLHTRAGLGETAPKLSWKIDEEEARLVGLDRFSIARQLETSLDGTVDTFISESTEQIPIRIRHADRFRQSLPHLA